MKHCRFITTFLRLALAATLATAAWGAAPRAAWAADLTIEVDSALDSNDPAYQVCSAAAADCSLRGAISKANADAANVYTILLQPGASYALTLPGAGETNNASGDLNLRAGMTINGRGARIDALGLDRVMWVGNYNIDITLQNLTLTGGQAPDSTRVNSSGESGGGIYSISEGTLRLVDCVIRENAAGDGWSGLAGAPAGATAAAPGERGTSGGAGGGIHASNGFALILEGVIVEDNHAGAGGNGGPGGAGNAAFPGAAGGNGGTGGMGGGVTSNAASLVLTNTTIRDNWTGNGGQGGAGGRGGDNPGGDATAGGKGGDSSTGGNGGGVYAGGLIASQSAIYGNTAGNGPGGGRGGDGGVSGSGLGGNGGAGGAGGLAGTGAGMYHASNLAGASNRVTNVTFSTNVAGLGGAGGSGGAGGDGTSAAGSNGATGTSQYDGEGGALVNAGSNPLYLNFVTMTRNLARRGGGLKNHGTIYARNSIFAGNYKRAGGTGEDVYIINAATPFYSDGFNLFGMYLTNLLPTDQVVSDASALGLLPLADNGGPTWTVALAEDSPAVDAAACTDRDGVAVAVDQRGNARPVGQSCDRGAFEYGRPVLPVQYLPLVVQ